MPKKMYRLTQEDLNIIENSKENGSWFTSFYFRHPSRASGWSFDSKITIPWQLDLHSATQSDIIVIAGFGTGKTVAVGMSAVTYASTLDDFKFLNVAPTAWQSKQMYDKIIAESQGTIWAERMLWKNVERPFPKIVVQYILPNGDKFTSSLEFMSANDNAENIRTWEGDWCNVDQAEMMDNLTELWANLGTRTRGTARGGRVRMGRLSAIANADDNPELWSLASLAEDYPDTNKFISVPTSSNKNLDDTQIASFIRRLGNDPERVKQYLDAKKPMGKGVEFSRELVSPCIDHNLDIEMKHNMETETFGWELATSRDAGTTLWKMPYDDSSSYVVVGDMGQGHAPLRNAPVVMVFDVGDFPNSHVSMRAFWWGDGGGKYEGWINKFQQWMKEFHAINGAYDATGGQKMLSETAFADSYNIVPVDLSNIKKRSCMITLKLMMMRQLIRIPGDIIGLTSQLLKYRLPDDKIPQDIVATLFVFAGYMRAMGYEIPEETLEADLGPAPYQHMLDRAYRMPIDRYARRER